MEQGYQELLNLQSEWARMNFNKLSKNTDKKFWLIFMQEWVWTYKNGTSHILENTKKKWLSKVTDVGVWMRPGAERSVGGLEPASARSLYRKQYRKVEKWRLHQRKKI